MNASNRRAILLFLRNAARPAYNTLVMAVTPENGNRGERENLRLQLPQSEAKNMRGAVMQVALALFVIGLFCFWCYMEESC